MLILFSELLGGWGLAWVRYGQLLARGKASGGVESDIHSYCGIFGIMTASGRQLVAGNLWFRIRIRERRLKDV